MIVFLKVRVDGEGKVTSASIQQNSGLAAFDLQALNAANLVTDLPPPPQETPGDFVVPLEWSANLLPPPGWDESATAWGTRFQMPSGKPLWFGKIQLGASFAEVESSLESTSPPTATLVHLDQETASSSAFYPVLQRAQKRLGKSCSVIVTCLEGTEQQYPQDICGVSMSPAYEFITIDGKEMLLISITAFIDEAPSVVHVLRKYLDERHGNPDWVYQTADRTGNKVKVSVWENSSSVLTLAPSPDIPGKLQLQYHLKSKQQQEVTPASRLPFGVSGL